MVQGFRLTIPKNVKEQQVVQLQGIESGVQKYLGKLYHDGKVTHIVCKQDGYSWYYNQYQGTQYSPACVHIFRVNDREETDTEEIFGVEFPVSFDWRLKKEK